MNEAYVLAVRFRRYGKSPFSRQRPNSRLALLKSAQGKQVTFELVLSKQGKHVRLVFRFVRRMSNGKTVPTAHDVGIMTCCHKIASEAVSRLYKRGNLARSIADNAWARRATCSVFAHERVYYLTRKSRCAIFRLVLDSQHFGNAASVFDCLARGIVVNEHARNADYLQPRIHKQARRNRRIDAAAHPQDDTRTWV